MHETSEDYPISPTVDKSKAHSKPHPRVKCARCPNATWIEDLQSLTPSKKGDAQNSNDADVAAVAEVPNYGADDLLRCQCTALQGKWVWPMFNVGNCDARDAAIRAERPDPDN